MFPILQESGPGFFRFAHENDVDHIAEIIFLNGDPRAANHGKGAALFELGQLVKLSVSNRGKRLSLLFGCLCVDGEFC